MAGQLKLRRGTTSQLANFIGSEGELTYDTALKSLVLHDGVTLGGVKIPYLSNGRVPSTMLPIATESVVGASKIATTAIAQAGTNDTDFITAKKLRDALNATGSSPVFACRAWLNMNGQGSVTIRASANIASVVREQAGVYLVKTSVAMPIVNFAVLVGGSFSSAVSGSNTNGNINIVNVSADSFRVFYSDGGTNDLYNLTLGVFC